MTMQVNLREFANLKEEEVLRWMGVRKAVDVTDDAGTVTPSDTFALMLSWQGYILHRQYPEAPFSGKHLIPSKRGANKKAIVYEDSVLAMPLEEGVEWVLSRTNDPLEEDLVKRMIHIWQTKMHNLSVVMGNKSIISATDYSVVELRNDPGIVEIRRQVLDKEVTIDEGEQLFKDYILDADSLDNNTVALLARTGGVSINQAYQKVGFRGGVFDLDNTILPNPIMRSYAEGIIDATDALGDSRSPGKSLNANGKALKDSEWFHRRSHLATAVMRSIRHMDDCGTTHLVPIFITSMDVAAALKGKFRQMPAGNLAPIDRYNIKDIKTGDIVHIRSVATCRYSKNGTPCGVCYGRLKSVIPYNSMMHKDANIGMFASTTICNPLGQMLLSTKHFIRNAVTKKFDPRPQDRDIIFSNGNDIFLKKELCRKGTKLLLKSSIVKYLSDLKALDSLENLNMSKLPHFAEAAIIYDVEDIMMGGMTTQQHALHVSVSSRQAHFSMGFLNYIMENGWVNEDKKNITIDLGGWTSEEPMFNLPFTREDLDAHRARVEQFVTFAARNKQWKEQVVTPKVFGDTLQEFWTLINQETKGVNMVYLEVILSALLTKDPFNYNYGLGAGSTEKYFSSFSSCVEYRGAGVLMISQGQQVSLGKPKLYMMKDKPNNPLEAFFQNAVS